MYRVADYENGEPMRLYRSVEEIRGDIARISEKIEETESMFNVRQMLLDLLSERRDLSGESWVDAVESLLDGARRALEGLDRLRASLSDLEDELEETEWALRI